MYMITSIKSAWYKTINFFTWRTRAEPPVENLNRNDENEDAPRFNIPVRDSIESITSEDEIPYAAPHSRTNKKEEAARRGEFYFKETILDRLDEYFRLINRMRRSDPDAFALYSKIGASIVTDVIPTNSALSPGFLAERPSFGAVAYVGTDYTKIDIRDDAITPAFVYFTKYASLGCPATIERPAPNEDVYVSSVFFTKRESRERDGVKVEYAVGVSHKTGKIRLLKSKLSSSVKCRIKHGKDRGRHFIFHKQEWGIPPMLHEWAKNKQGMSTEEFLCAQFAFSAGVIESSAYSNTRIDVKKGTMHAAFSVDIKRVPYFFKDRNTTITTATGAKRRVFHIVRPHLRKGTVAVKMHFRGEREFGWNGYRVRISVPGKHHVTLHSFSGGLLDSDQVPSDTDVISMTEMADRMQHHLAA